MTAAANRHLLFGLLALQNGLIDQGALVAAFQAWTRDKTKSLADQLVTRGDLDADARAGLDAIVALHIRKHGDVEKSLAAVPAGESARESLARIGDPDIEHTLGHVGSGHRSTENGDFDRTASYAVGESTGDGQRFRILRPHARGGLGAVFVALDSELHREVAVKQILDKHADDAVSRQRFLLEAEVTGGLEHPGIVPVYGLGTYADGRPYYAMRFIKGDSLKEAIDRFHSSKSAKDEPGRRTLELRGLLRRFADVCNAIEYAHSRGVLHRDIKPGNIIVGRHGETLVVDWGLAKATGRSDPSAAERTLLPSSSSGSSETLPGFALGTPGYMSPEQAEGRLELLGPRSDVYSLGATLYCLLTGQPPFTGEVVDVIRAVQRGEFPAPRAIDSSVDPALEAICLKAMARTSEDRYPSGRSLCDDLDRWMADEPVSAWREPLARRARRWARRNRTAVSAAVVSLVAGVVGLAAVLAVQTQAKAALAESLKREMAAKTELAETNSELSRSRAAVEARYDLAVAAIKTFHTGVSQDFLLKQGQFKEIRDRLLGSASDFYGKLGALLGKESDLASRRALLKANYEVADLTGDVGSPEAALAAHRQVLAARERLAVEYPADAAIKSDVGRSLTAVAFLLEETGRTKEAEVTYREAETRLVELDPTIADAAETRVALAYCRSSLGWLLHTTGRNDEALSVLRLARADQEVLAAAPRATAESRRELARTIDYIAVILSDTGKSSEAEAEYRKAQAIQQKLVDDNPTVTRFPKNLAHTHTSLGTLLKDAGKSSEAEAEYRKALAIQQKLAADNPAVTEFREDLATTHSGLGFLWDGTGKSLEAEAEHRKALAIQKKLVADNPRVTDYRYFLSLSHNGLGRALSSTGKSSEAETEYREALAIQQKLAADNPTVIGFRDVLAFSHQNLGALLRRMGKLSEAEAEYRKALAIQQKLDHDNPAFVHYRLRLAFSHNNLAILLQHNGRLSDAVAEYQKALAIFQKLVDDNPGVSAFLRNLANNLDNIGWRLAQAGKTGEAIGYYAREEAIWRKITQASSATPADRDSLANCHVNAADVLRRSGRLDEALVACDRALALREPLVAVHPESPEYRAALGEPYLGLAQVRCDKKDPAGAAAALKRACGHYAANKSLPSDRTFLLACCHAGLAGIAEMPGSGLSPAQGAGHAEQAMAVLRQAVMMGYRDRGAYRTEAALDPLRNRPDFQLLMMDLAMPADPFAK